MRVAGLFPLHPARLPPPARRAQTSWRILTDEVLPPFCPQSPSSERSGAILKQLPDESKTREEAMWARDHTLADQPRLGGAARGAQGSSRGGRTKDIEGTRAARQDGPTSGP